MVDVWDLQYQELLVEAHAQDTQVIAQVGCDDKFVTGDDIIAQNKKKYEIK
jgi:hypothetical protein